MAIWDDQPSLYREFVIGAQNDACNSLQRVTVFDVLNVQYLTLDKTLCYKTSSLALRKDTRRYYFCS